MPIFIIESKSSHPNHCSKKEIFFTGISPDHYSWLTAGTCFFFLHLQKYNFFSTSWLLFGFSPSSSFWPVTSTAFSDRKSVIAPLQKILKLSSQKSAWKGEGRCKGDPRAPTCEVINQANGRLRNNTGVHTGPAWYPDPGEKGWRQMRRSANFISAS